MQLPSRWLLQSHHGPTLGSCRLFLERTQACTERIACTSQLRKWGVPGEADFHKEPVMNTTIKKRLHRKGIISTLYDPRNQQLSLTTTKY